jgi:hypothetical protein
MFDVIAIWKIADYLVFFASVLAGLVFGGRDHPFDEVVAPVEKALYLFFGRAMAQRIHADRRLDGLKSTDLSFEFADLLLKRAHRCGQLGGGGANSASCG